MDVKVTSHPLINMEMTGKTTLADAVQSGRALLGLFEAVAETVAPTQLAAAKIISRDGFTFWDGPDRPETRELVPECSERCKERVPGFADCEFPVSYHCRGCSLIVCWRHAKRTDLTGAWCESCG